MAEFEVDLPEGTITVQANSEYEAYVKALETVRNAARQQQAAPQAQPVQQQAAQPAAPQPSPVQQIPQPNQLFTPREPSKLEENLMGRLETLGVGAQKRLQEAGRGAYGSILRTGESIGLVSPERLQEYTAETERMRPEFTPRSSGEFVGGFIPDVIGGGLVGGGLKMLGRGLQATNIPGIQQAGRGTEFIGQSVIAPRTIGEAATGGAIYSQTIPYRSDREALVGIGAGAATSAAMQPVLRAVGLTPSAPTNLTAAQQEAGRRSVEAGFQYTPGQMSGSKTMQMIEEGTKALPFGRAPFEALADANQDALRRIAAVSIGLPEDAAITRSTIMDAADNALKSYGDLRTIPPIKLDKGFEQIIDRELNKLQKLPLNQRKGQGINDAIRTLQDYKKLTSSAIDGEGIEMSLKALTDDVFRSSKEGKVAAGAYKTLRNEFENAIDRQLQVQALNQAVMPEVIQNYRKGREILSNIYTVDDAFNEATGQISGKKLATQLSKRSGYGARGTDLETAALASTAFPPVIGSSGTSERQQAADLIKSASTGLLSGTYTGDVSTGALAALGSAVVPRVASKAMTSEPVRSIVARRQLGAVAPDEGRIAQAMRILEERVPADVRAALGNIPRTLAERYLIKGLLGD